jgi:hypothetical protein
MQCLERFGAGVAESVMSACCVVFGFNILEHGLSHLLASCEAFTVNEFDFQRVEKLSAQALSKQLPLPLIEHDRLCASSQRW